MGEKDIMTISSFDDATAAVVVGDHRVSDWSSRHEDDVHRPPRRLEGQGWDDTNENNIDNDWYVDSQTATNQQKQFEHNVESMFGIGTSHEQQQQQQADYYGMMSSSSSSSYYDPYTSNYTKDVNTSAFLTALYFNVVIFVILIGCYEIFRRWFPTVYSPRTTTNASTRDATSHHTTASTAGSMLVDSVPSSSSSSSSAINVNVRWPLGWIPGVIRASWSVVRTSGGLDSYMFLRYVRLCSRITLTSSLWGMIILWPVYASGDGGAHGWYFLSMANIRHGSHRLWAPAIFVWLQTLYVLFLMSEEYKHYLECRIDFLSRGEGSVPNNQHMYSLIVERIPHELRSDAALYDYFSRLFPNKVHSTAVVLNLPDLERECRRRRRVLRRLEKSNVSLEVRGRRPRHVVGRKRLRCCGIETSPIFASSCVGRRGGEGGIGTPSSTTTTTTMTMRIS
jgi:hypothetical protein